MWCNTSGTERRNAIEEGRNRTEFSWLRGCDIHYNITHCSNSIYILLFMISIYSYIVIHYMYIEHY